MEPTDKKADTPSIRQLLDELYPERVTAPANVRDIPRDRYVVYILVYEGKVVVLGHGKYNRAKVIFDHSEQITTNHIKAIYVRCYQLFGNGSFERFIIPCTDKAEARTIEAALHKIIGGNCRELPPDIRTALFSGIPAGSNAEMVLRQSLVSAFDGLYDLKLWRRKGILPENVWSLVGGKLLLNDPLK